MSFQPGDDVRYIDTPSQTGMVTRLHPLGIQESMEVKMHDGPMFSDGHMRAYFGVDCELLEVYTP